MGGPSRRTAPSSTLSMAGATHSSRSSSGCSRSPVSSKGGPRPQPSSPGIQRLCTAPVDEVKKIVNVAYVDPNDPTTIYVTQPVGQDKVMDNDQMPYEPTGLKP